MQPTVALGGFTHWLGWRRAPAVFMCGGIGRPVQHGRSGIKTFIVSHRGDVFERDLGPETTRIARGVTAFDPGEGWSRWRSDRGGAA